MSTDYYKEQSNAAEYIKLAEGHDGVVIIEQYQAFIASNALVLEIGSGPGSDWGIWNKSHEIIGSDTSPTFIKHLSEKYKQGTFIELDAATLDTDLNFDAIYSNKVLHHLSNKELQESIKRQHQLLTPGGTICHSFWNGDGDEVFKGMFVNYHDKKNLTEHFSPYFEILKMEEYAEFEESDSIFVIAKKIAHQ